MAPLPEVVETVGDLRRRVAQWRAEGLKCAVVPTMGALHAGHLTLVKEGLARAPRVVTTIFINPRQFAANEDLDRYPRNAAHDLEMLGDAGASLVFMPERSVMYPAGFATTVSLAGPAAAKLEDKYRPHFFAGVATVVAKLFIQSGCDYAMFGEKDYQQLKVVTRMARDLDIPTEVVGVPTVREPDGLAMSSRNAYLSAEDRALAPAIHATLQEAARSIRAGARPDAATAKARRALGKAGFAVDYVEARNAETLEKLAGPAEPIRLLAAAKLGTTRLIDNIAV